MSGQIHFNLTAQSIIRKVYKVCVAGNVSATYSRRGLHGLGHELLTFLSKHRETSVCVCVSVCERSFGKCSEFVKLVK